MNHICGPRRSEAECRLREGDLQQYCNLEGAQLDSIREMASFNEMHKPKDPSNFVDIISPCYQPPLRYYFVREEMHKVRRQEIAVWGFCSALSAMLLNWLKSMHVSCVYLTILPGIIS